MAEAANKSGPRKGRRRLRWCLLVIVALPAAGILYANLAAVMASRGRMFDHAIEVPAGRVGLVFGCDDMVGGRENLFFRNRIDAAAELWKTGRLRCLIVSGDNESDKSRYNEPQKMRGALIEAGVPAAKIACDPAGMRTLDSVVRAKEIFGVEKVVFISQRFQNERALYLARTKGIDAVAFNADDVEAHRGWKVWLREIGARVKMWLDVRVLGTRPQHNGDKRELPA